MARPWATGWLLAAALLAGCPGSPPPPEGADPVGLLRGGEETAGYARVTGPRPLRFPRDHGPHPAFRQEWWYWTGTLRAPDGRRYGFQLTFFRRALRPPGAPPRGSAWAAEQLWLVHGAVSDPGGDPEAGRFRPFRRLERQALGLAGGQARPFRVWVRDWEARSTGASLLPLRLRARDGGWGLDLVLTAGRGPFLQGRQGYSRKGEDPASASLYYSLTRLLARGELLIEGRRVPVEGLAWMDREWSSAALEPGQAGWDWTALHLEDGSDLMLYRIRREGGGADPRSAGLLVGPDGRPRVLAAGDFRMVPLGPPWRSPRTGIRYPLRWRLELPGEGLVLELEPWLEGQELAFGLRYWEGAVSARGRRGGRPVRGEGYLELVGYGPRGP